MRTQVLLGNTTRILLGATAAAVVALVGYLGLVLTSGRPDVPARRLLASDAAAPTGDGSGQWRVDGDVDMGDQPATVKEGIQRVWKRSGGSNIREVVFRYGNPLWARISYRASSPSSNDDYPAVHSPKNAYHGAADRSQLVCGAGSVQRCDTGEYWAQYGQYLVRVKYIGGGVPMDADTFTSYVAPIDRYISQQLHN